MLQKSQVSRVHTYHCWVGWYKTLHGFVKTELSKLHFRSYSGLIFYPMFENNLSHLWTLVPAIVMNCCPLCTHAAMNQHHKSMQSFPSCSKRNRLLPSMSGFFPFKLSSWMEIRFCCRPNCEEETKCYKVLHEHNSREEVIMHARQQGGMLLDQRQTLWIIKPLLHQGRSVYIASLH